MSFALSFCVCIIGLLASVQCGTGKVTNNSIAGCEDTDNCMIEWLPDKDKDALGSISKHMTEIIHSSNIDAAMPLWQRTLNQARRYVQFGVPKRLPNANNSMVFEKLNFLQSIAYHYCNISMNDDIITELGNMAINESQLFFQSSIFPIQIVTAFGLFRLEFCDRIKNNLLSDSLQMFTNILETDDPDQLRESYFTSSEIDEDIARIASWFSDRFGEEFGLYNYFSDLIYMKQFVTKFQNDKYFEKRKDSGYIVSRLIDWNEQLKWDWNLIYLGEFAAYGYVAHDLIDHNRDCHEGSPLPALAQATTSIPISAFQSNMTHDDMIKTVKHFIEHPYELEAACIEDGNITINVGGTLVELITEMQNVDSLLKDTAIQASFELYKLLHNETTFINEMRLYMLSNLFYDKIPFEAMYPYIVKIFNDTSFRNQFIAKQENNQQLANYLFRMMSYSSEVAKDVSTVKWIATHFKSIIHRSISAELDNDNFRLWNNLFLNHIFEQEYFHLSKFFFIDHFKFNVTKHAERMYRALDGKFKERRSLIRLKIVELFQQAYGLEELK